MDKSCVCVSAYERMHKQSLTTYCYMYEWIYNFIYPMITRMGFFSLCYSLYVYVRVWVCIINIFLIIFI